MGVCGSGKSEVGQALARLIAADYADADDFHSPQAREKMRSGTPLTDDDRWPWLHRLRRHILDQRAPNRHLVLACSALRAPYRHILRGNDSPRTLRFILLDGPRELIAARIQARQHHYMPPSLLDSQLALLERTPDLLTVSIEPPPAAIATHILQLLSAEAAA